MSFGFGWIKDDYDSRDKLFSITKREELPSYANIISKLPNVFDQLTLGSCVAQASVAAFYSLLKKQETHVFVGSRLLVYYEGRKILGTINEDSGMMIRDSLKILEKLGICDEKLWPYLIDKFKEAPPAECYVEAEKKQLLEYSRVKRDLYDLKKCLTDGYPVVFGMEVFDGMFTSDARIRGWVNMPVHGETTHGSHCAVIVGYDDQVRRFILRNSWGQLGMGGHFTLPFEYFLDEKLTSDFWTLRLIEN